jgi:hypothetical protein
MFDFPDNRHTVSHNSTTTIFPKGIAWINGVSRVMMVTTLPKYVPDPLQPLPELCGKTCGFMTVSCVWIGSKRWEGVRMIIWDHSGSMSPFPYVQLALAPTKGVARSSKSLIRRG